MDENSPQTHGPQRHSYRLKPLIAIVLGLVGGAAMLFVVMAWYFTRIDPGDGPPGLDGDGTKATPNVRVKQ
jgi:hypothetical protein